MLHDHKDFVLPDSSHLSSQLNAFLKTVLPQDVFAYAMPLEVSDEFRGELLKQGIALKVADGAVLKRQCEYLAGRYCAQQSLLKIEEKDAIKLANKEVGTGESREPIWPEGIIGAITHSNRFAMAILTQAQGAYLGIGLDIEEEMSESLAQELSGQILSEAENLLNKSNEIFDNKTFVTLVFSAKESIFKAIFPSVGEYFGFDACELIELNPLEQSLSFRLVSTLSPDWQAGKRLKVKYFALPSLPLSLDKKASEPAQASWLTLAFIA